MGKMRNAFRLMKASWGVFKEDKKIIFFPLMSSILFIVIIASIFAPLYLLNLFSLSSIFSGHMIYLFSIPVYFVAFFLGTFFNTAVFGSAYARLRGKKLSFTDALKLAQKNWYRILVWAVLASTVGIVLQFIRDKAGILGKILGTIGGIAWTYGTFFIVPVLIIENKSVMGSLKSSSKLFVDTWGETLIGSIGFGIVFVILGFIVLAPLLMITALGMIHWMVGLVIAVLFLILLSSFSSAMNGIFVTALYNYAKDGTLPGPFTHDMIPSPKVESTDFSSWSGSKSASNSFYDHDSSWRR